MLASLNLGKNKLSHYVTIMNNNTVDNSEIKLIVPVEDGKAIEIGFTKNDIQEFTASEPWVQDLKNKCKPVATSGEYNLLVLDF